MSNQKQRVIIGLAVSISVILLAAVVMLAIKDRQPAEQIQTTTHHQYEHPTPEPQHPASEQASTLQKDDETGPQLPAESGGGEPVKTNAEPLATDEPTQIDIEPVIRPKKSLNDIIRAARRWGPINQSWFGRAAPDFTLTDIAGKEHKLSDYQGKDVLLTFWATWCPPCLVEIPELITLRKTVSEDELAILAVSYITAMPRETPEIVKEFSEQNKLNYTVFSADARTMPAPFSTIRNIPSTFFIDSEGKIKLVTTGMLLLHEIKDILQAEWP